MSSPPTRRCSPITASRLRDSPKKHGVALDFRGGGRRRHSGHQDHARRACGNAITRVYGILNGTCNYILTRMERRGPRLRRRSDRGAGARLCRSRSDLRRRRLRHRAQAVAPHQPGLRHAGRASTRSTSRASRPSRRPISRRRTISAIASSCSASRMKTDSGIEQRVHPTMVAKGSAIAQVDGVTNCVAIDGDFVGDVLLVGPAPAATPRPRRWSAILPTSHGAAPACAVCAPAREDLSQYQRAQCDPSGRLLSPPVGVRPPGPWRRSPSAWPRTEVSLESIVQRRTASDAPGSDGGPEPGEPVTRNVVLITHKTIEQAIRDALAAIEAEVARIAG